MIKKDSYGFNTYAGLRVAEIQKKTDVDSWKHIPSAENIADILTRGAKPDKLGPGSIWHSGPEWLVKSEEVWPVTDMKLTCEENEDVQKYQKAAKKVLTLSAMVSKLNEDGIELDGLIDT